VKSPDNEVFVTDKLSATLQNLVGLECWYVSAGGSAGSSFSLAFGQRVPRKRPLKNPNVSDEFRDYEGEANMLVWCSWRLDDQQEAIVSCDCEPSVIVDGLGLLRGRQVTSCEILSPAHDLRIAFAELTLSVFCDHVPPKPSFDGNWELHLLTEIHAVGPGWKYEVEPRR
jgi:hypothetical protein